MMKTGEKVVIGIIGGIVIYATNKALRGEDVLDFEDIRVSLEKTYEKAQEVAKNVKEKVDSYQPIFVRKSKEAEEKQAKMKEFYAFAMEAYAFKNKEERSDSLKGFEFESYSEAMVAMLDYVVEDEERGSKELRELLAMAMDFGRFANSEYAKVPPTDDENDFEEVIEAEAEVVEVVTE